MNHCRRCKMTDYPRHPLKQDKKLLKVNGGVVGLTQNPTALQDFALHRQVLRLCVHNF